MSSDGIDGESGSYKQPEFLKRKRHGGDGAGHTQSCWGAGRPLSCHQPPQKPPPLPPGTSPPVTGYEPQLPSGPQSSRPGSYKGEKGPKTFPPRRRAGPQHPQEAGGGLCLVCAQSPGVLLPFWPPLCLHTLASARAGAACHLLLSSRQLTCHQGAEGTPGVRAEGQEHGATAWTVSSHRPAAAEAEPGSPARSKA